MRVFGANGARGDLEGWASLRSNVDVHRVGLDPASVQNQVEPGVRNGNARKGCFFERCGTFGTTPRKLVVNVLHGARLDHKPNLGLLELHLSDVNLAREQREQPRRKPDFLHGQRRRTAVRCSDDKLLEANLERPKIDSRPVVRLNAELISEQQRGLLFGPRSDALSAQYEAEQQRHRSDSTKQEAKKLSNAAPNGN